MAEWAAQFNAVDSPFPVGNLRPNPVYIYGIVKGKNLLLLLFGLLFLGPGRARPPALGTGVGLLRAVRVGAAATALTLVPRLVAALSSGAREGRDGK